MSNAQFSIGIDLGTTNCALAWIDLHASTSEKSVSGVLDVAQFTGPGVVESAPLLPSFLYLPHPDELATGELSLPWSAVQNYAVGEFARKRGSTTPIRLVSSAKSWLCHAGVDRRATILPSIGVDRRAPNVSSDTTNEVERISPIEATTRYLAHLRMAWNHTHPEAPFDEQDITVTVPASFDPSARALTLEAAKAAGYLTVTLLEEPQAALYHWISCNAGNWRKEVKPGDIILVVDVGGGTSDFSLVAVLEQEGNLEFHRIAVGDHILLGGDNMDFTLANVVARKLSAAGTSLDPWQMRALTYACRSAKERFLGDANAETVPIVIHSRGSKLVGGAIRTELLADEVRRVILDGFFPDVPVSARPISRPRGGLAQPGLPYAQDTGVTRHLAAFLGRQVNATAEMPGFVPAPQADVSFIHPSAVLFNGGVFKPNVLVERTIATLDSWLAAEKAAAIRVLDATDLDKAVAQGAAYYGYVRRGQGMRIRGGTACAYYVAIESSMPPVPDGVKPPIHALCVAPFGMQEGKYLDLTSQHFGLLVGEPVYLRFFSSSVRRQDQFGALLYSWQPDELIELGQIDVTLSPECHAAGDVVEVRLRAGVTDSGTLELIAADIHDDDEWKVEFFVPAKPERSMLQYSVEIDFESGE